MAGISACRIKRESNLFSVMNTEKEIVMQLDSIRPSESDGEEECQQPESILVCSDGSVVVGLGSTLIDVIYWYPCFEMIPYFLESQFDIDQYVACEPTVKELSTHHLLVGPLQ